MTRPVSRLKLALSLVYLPLWLVLILFLAGDWGWREGWIFGGWLVALSATVIVWLYVKDPALLAERYRMPGSGGQSQRDRVIVYLLMVAFLSWIALMPLDGRRFRWTPPLPLAVEIAGGALLAVASFFMVRSFVDNSFASPLVRIQREREHRVVSTGVYGVVRHPMYLGAILMFFGGALLTGAATAFVAALALVAILAVRIGEEEKLLVTELPGYEEYRRRVRYRLLPRVW